MTPSPGIEPGPHWWKGGVLYHCANPVPQNSNEFLDDRANPAPQNSNEFLDDRVFSIFRGFGPRRSSRKLKTLMEKMTKIALPIQARRTLRAVE